MFTIEKFCFLEKIRLGFQVMHIISSIQLLKEIPLWFMLPYFLIYSDSQDRDNIKGYVCDVLLHFVWEDQGFNSAVTAVVVIELWCGIVCLRSCSAI